MSESKVSYYEKFAAADAAVVAREETVWQAAAMNLKHQLYIYVGYAHSGTFVGEPSKQADGLQRTSRELPSEDCVNQNCERN